MQNKANFKKAGINVNYYLQEEYENEQLSKPRGKQTQSNPMSKQSKAHFSACRKC